MNNEKKRMNELVARLSAANRAYYHENREIITDREYDSLYDELVRLEESTGVRLAGSPTRKVGYEVVSALKKIPHTTPMLSLDKTKDPEALAEFLGDREGLLSWKLDGLSIVLKYDGGELQQALTRGNGTIGEDVTHNARVFRNVPLTVPYKNKFELRGEAVISVADFEAINETEEQKYKNPRNLCSGAVRQLSSEITARRRVLFFAFGLVEGEAFEKKSDRLEWLAAQGFEITAFERVTAETVVAAVAEFKARIPSAPILSDGLVLTYDDISYSESLGATSKFPRDSLAFKWADEIAETTLREIEWGTSRTGLVNPVAVFEPVEIEGTMVSRAAVHNVSILRGLGLRPGDRIAVYKANMIIPQVAENLSGGGEVEIPAACTVCGGETEIVGEPETLYCTNPNCGAQQIRALSHFVSRDALNIAGLSEQTLEKLISRGFVANFLDLFFLEKHENEIRQMEGFGQKSVENLLQSVEAAKDIPLSNFIYALGIRHVGLANAKLLCAFFAHDALKIAEACRADDYLEILSEVKGFGEAISHSLHVYFSREENFEQFKRALEVLRIAVPAAFAENRVLDGLTFVITGDVTQFKNRAELQTHIENHGGRVTGSVTAKTSFLINNDALSPSAKNKKAAKLGVPVLTEGDFLARFFA